MGPRARIKRRYQGTQWVGGEWGEGVPPSWWTLEGATALVVSGRCHRPGGLWEVPPSWWALESGSHDVNSTLIENRGTTQTTPIEQEKAYCFMAYDIVVGYRLGDVEPQETS